VLVTGHTGFKGSWLALWLRRLGADVCGLALPAEGELNHSRLLGLSFDEALVDLRDAGAVRAALARFGPRWCSIWRAAAGPAQLPGAGGDLRRERRRTRQPARGPCGSTRSVRVVVNATTDKCYLERPTPSGYCEGDALGGRDPYSASKACAEIVSASYRSSFLRLDDGRGHPVGLATARAGNVIGGGDWSEDRLIPDLVARPVRGRVDGDPLSAGDTAMAARAGAACGLSSARPAAARRSPHPRRKPGTSAPTRPGI
jgi:CDP-glucose 4,6-dehydratase